MSVLTAPTEIADLVTSTQRDLGRLKFQNIAQNLVYYEVFSRWFKKDRVAFDSGIGIQRTLMHKLDSTSPRHTGYLDSDDVTMQDVLTTMQVPWVHAQTNWAIIYQTDILMNTGKEMILNVIKPRRAAALLGLVEELETRAWSAPTSATEDKYPMGIPYWVVANSSDGFNGGASDSGGTVANVTLADAPNFKNYTFTYSSSTSGSLVKKARKAHRNCGFISPISIDDYRGGMGNRYRCYTDEETISDLEDVATGQNENLGRDIATMDGTVTFRRHPIIWVPELDSSSTSQPFYMIDHSTFYPAVLRGDYLRESEAKEVPGKHNVYAVFVDLTYNFVCVDRRRNALGYQA